MLPNTGCLFREISGCVVVYKLVSALQDTLATRGIPDYPQKNREYLQLAALGTIGDNMPLRNENRVIVRYGLAALTEKPRKGLAELLAMLGLTGKPVSAEEVSWVLCPAINSAGRMGCPDKAVRLLLEHEPQKRIMVADEIKALNLFKNPVVLEGEAISRGMTGIMANYGSHTSTPGFTMRRFLWDQCTGRLEIETESVQLKETPDNDNIDFDAELPRRHITPDILKIVDRFEPYGEGNKPLVFVSRGLKISNLILLSKRGEPKHVKFILDTGEYKWPAILWNGSTKIKGRINSGDKVDICYTFKRNRYNGTERPQLIIKDIVKSAMF
jgi:single-stranded-DNA-specific exonuclease